jgi:hypothetical protein
MQEEVPALDTQAQSNSNPLAPAVGMTTIQRTGYMGFGSFMVEQSVEDMITATPYQPPPLPFSLPAAAACSGLSKQTPLGAYVRSEFLIDFGTWTFINHGAFGGVCSAAHAEANAWREHCERQPLKFIDRCELSARLAARVAPFSK